MRITLFTFVLVGLMVASALAAPKISEEFSSIIKVNILDPRSNHTGHGIWASSLREGKTTQHFDFGRKHPLNELHLQRFDLRAAYEEYNDRKCEKQALDGAMSPVWDWVNIATESTKFIGSEKFAVYSFTMGYATVSLYLKNDSTPRYFIVEGDYRTVTIEFMHWIAATPAASMFNVPQQCKASNFTSAVGCVARNTMISRAQAWVDQHIPYSQSATHDGYRMDCSGYVSMAWESAMPGHSCGNMHLIAHPIPRSQLQPGDVLLCATEHVVMFGGWSGPSHYVSYEETRPGEGTVKRITPYPYWYNTGCFLPYRYNSVC